MTPHELFKRRLIRLIELSNEMALCASDRRFARAELVQPIQDGAERTGDTTNENIGKIYYVFDESALEVFINPDDSRRKYPAYFHVQDWRDEGEVRDEQYWIRINEMIAIVAAEHMLLGKLPGSSVSTDDAIYMTHWHRKELGQSSEKVGENYLEKVGANPQRAMRERDAVFRQIEFANEGHEIGLFDKSDLKLKDDLASLREHLKTFENTDVESEVANFLRARRIARAFAEHWELFVADQLRRITKHVNPRLKSLNDKFQIESNSEEALIRREGHIWRDRLRKRREEQIQEGFRREKVRPEAGLLRDGLSLALVQHIARNRLQKSERIVLVTGDRLMLETYWDWYAERYVAAPFEPNVIRSVGRFSPIMNYSDMLDAGVRLEGPFQLMQVAMDTALARFNYKPHQDLDVEDPQKIANLWSLSALIRKSIAQPSLVKEYLPPDATVSPSAFDTIKDRYQEIERNAFRVGLKVLERRSAELLEIENDYRAGLTEGSDATGSDEAAIEYFRRMLAGVVKDNVRLWLPIVHESLKVDTYLADANFRAPITLALTVFKNEGVDEVDLLDFEKALRTRPLTARDRRSLEKAPHLVFVLGILFAIRNRFWSDADRFAELAKTAYRHVVSASEDSARAQDDYQELRYLRAVCSRLMIGSADPTAENEDRDDKEKLRGLGEDIWLDHLNTATRNLDLAQTFHDTMGERVRALRAISERASARFFYSSWAIFMNRSTSGYDREMGIEQFRLGVADLHLAFDRSLLLAAEERKTVRPKRERMLENARRQILVNIAAADSILRHRHPFGLSHKFGDLLPKAKESVGEWIAKDTGELLPLVVQTEVIDFARAHGFPPPLFLRRGSSPRLPLDRRIAEFLRA